MDLIDQIRELSNKVPKLKQSNLLKTEEGTKNALVMPFIAALGYNVFDPLEVTPELIADVGIKKGEKVDYAILKDGKPIMLFECKIFGTDLGRVQASQLYRYFSVTETRFGIVTDGVVYQFFTDLEEPNKLDPKPFFVFDMNDVKDRDIEELKKFSKSAFDVTRILSSASELKYKGAIKQIIADQFAEPSEELVRLLTNRVYSGRLTQTVIAEFTDITKQAMRLYISEQIENRLKSALQQETEATTAEQKQLSKTVEAVLADDGKPVTTTEEEMEGHRIVRAILREVATANRITLRDAQSYCAILLDDNNRKTICRLRFNTAKKQIGIYNSNKEEETYPIASVDDIYKYADKLKAVVLHYDKAATGTKEVQAQS
jgi:predicted type IV restriction endonuclease